VIELKIVMKKLLLKNSVEITLFNITNKFSNMKSSVSSKMIICTKNYVYNNIFHNLNCCDDCFLESHKFNLARFSNM